MENNKDLVLIAGMSTAGKSASLMDIPDQEGVMYLNCEAGKPLPFPNKFQKFTITDPYQVYEAFDEAENMPEIHTIVIDTITFLMDMFESLYICGSSNSMQGWSDYFQYFKNLMQDKVAKSTKHVIVLAHTELILNESNMELETKIPVKGSLKKNGLEAYFTTIVYAKR
ncbi:MAG: AAA family ATPase, partial [Cetobacterium sp.]|uniref:AAA family ATPase n=1 Tax=Cetobacterium sp. TaxID=2071632 RepID=UPI003EE7DD01